MANCQPKRALKDELPSLYHRLVPEELLSFSIIETKANCSDCSMSPQNRGSRAKVTYEASLKCCTFDPWVPNFSVGALLQDSKLKESVRGALNGKITNIEECSPLGLRASTQFQRRFLRKKENEFGNREDWLCPYFNREANNCGIWAHRGNVCISFYCRSSYGVRGIHFWEELGDYLHLIELSLMEECLVQLDFSPRQLSDLLPLIDRQTHLKSKALPKITATDYRKFWNAYSDPGDFFVKCEQIVRKIKARDMVEILGESGERAWERLHRRMKGLLEKRMV